MRWLILALLVIPALEIAVFIWAGGIIGPWWVVWIILLTGILGIALAKYQGLETWKKAQVSMSNRMVPTEQIIDGICIFIGAVFLFAPGFITDFFGFILILPGTRRPFKYLIYKWIEKITQKRNGRIIYRKW